MTSTAAASVIWAMFAVYTFFMGLLAGMVIANYKDEVRKFNWVWRLLLVIALFLWPINVLIGYIIEKLEERMT